MSKRKVPEKVRRAAEKYLASLDSSRERLNEKQWAIVTEFVKERRSTQWKLACSVFLFVCCLLLSWGYYHFHRIIVAASIPANTIYIEQDGSTRVAQPEPEDIKTHVRVSFLLSAASGLTLCAAVSFLTIGLHLLLANRKKGKILNEFIPTGEPSRDNAAKGTGG
jgi:hypothetical protein